MNRSGSRAGLGSCERVRRVEERNLDQSKRNCPGFGPRSMLRMLELGCAMEHGRKKNGIIGNRKASTTSLRRLAKSGYVKEGKDVSSQA